MPTLFEVEAPAKTGSKPDAALAAKFRKAADAMQTKIDHAGRPMTQNPTPKRNREHQSRMIDCRNMERAQKALRILADAHETGTAPILLAGLRTKDDVSRLVRKGIDSGRGGYYSAYESDDYSVTTPDARMLQDMILADVSTEEQEARKTARRINELEAEVALSTIAGYFPTPEPVVRMMLDRADLLPSVRVLEPSAGKGNIADAIRQAEPTVHIEAVEPVLKLREILKLKGYELVGEDIMQLGAAELGKYDRIVMNPPFENQQDIEHVRRAASLLADDGVLVSIMSPSFTFRTDRRSVEFRAWLEDVGASVEDLPGGSFKTSGTGVATRMVTIRK